MITAQDFYDYEKCSHRVYLDHHGDPSEKLPLSDFLNLLFERALAHERDVIRNLPYETPEGKSLEERASATVALIKAGVERIYQGVLLSPDGVGIPDLIEKETSHSALGDCSYKPVDIKSGSGYKNEQKGSLRKDYALQLFHYARLLEQIQGKFPPTGEILNKRGERVVYPLVQFRELYEEVYSEIQELLSRTRITEPALNSNCKLCQWWGHCEPILLERRDVSLLPGIGPEIRLKLKEAGVSSIEDVPAFDFSKTKIKGLGQKTAESLVRLAKARLLVTWKSSPSPNSPILSSKSIWISKTILPRN